MGLHISSHPAVIDALGCLRDQSLTTASLRTQMSRLALVLTSQATGHLELTGGHRVTGAFGEVEVSCATPPVLVVVLRAGAALLDGALGVWPDAPVGFVGIARDEETLTASVYLERLGDLRGRDVIVLEPMLATGGSLTTALSVIDKAGPPRSVVVVGVVCSEPGVEVVTSLWPSVDLVYAACDPVVDADGFIRPGLGDAGDRAWVL